MGRMRQGWQLTKKSWGILRTNRQLAYFAIWGGVTAMIATALLMGPGFVLLSANQTAPGLALIAVGAYVATFVGIYFNVGLAAAADRAMRGESVTVAEGLAVARTRAGQIAGWALLAVTVNLLLSLLRGQDGIVGKIAGSLFSVAWNLATFLVVPVIALEGLGPIASLKQSASLFRQRWGQQITGNIAIGAAVALVTVLPAVILGVLAFLIISGGGSAVAAGIALGAVAVALLIVGAIVSGALRGIFGVALYRFASDGQAIGVFDAAELEGAVRTKR